MILKGMTFNFMIWVIFWVTAIYFNLRGSQGKFWDIRRIPAFDAIDEAIGRSTEQGRPIFFTAGYRSFERNPAENLVGFEMVRYVSRKAAELDAKLIIAVSCHDKMPMTMENYRAGCIEGGSPELFSEENVRYFSYNQWAYGTGVLGIMERERPGACIMIGTFLVEATHFGVISRKIGAMSVGGNQGISLFFFITTDYCLIGDEIFTAGAYVSRDPYSISGINSGDVLKTFLSLLIIFGTIMSSIGLTWFTNLLRM